MAKNQGGNPTEKPTEKRKKQAFKKGQVAYSSKFAGVIHLIGFVLLVLFFLNWVAQKIAVIAQLSFAGRISFSQSLVFGISALLELFIPLGLFLLVFTLAAGISQVGFRFNYHMLLPKLSNISPKEGFKRIFSLRKLWDLGLALVALTGVFLIIYFFLRLNLVRIIGLGNNNLKVSLENFSNLIINFLLFLLLFLIFAGLIDYIFVWFRQQRSLMMTRYEVEKEQKQDEGDPHHKSERKRLHQELLEEQMFGAIKEADLIVINPKHIAVALKEGSKGAPPRVIAGGINNIALHIKKIARREKIPIYRDVKLARSLYKLPEGEQIPPELYEAVATVLLTLDRYEEENENENRFKNIKQIF